MVFYELEEAGCRCRLVEGIDTEVETAGFTENKVLPQAAQGLLLGTASTACQCTPNGPARSTTSSFSASCFCIRLQHSMNVLHARMPCF